MSEHMMKPFEEELVRLKGMVRDMGELTGAQLQAAVGCIEGGDSELANSVIQREPQADRMMHEIDNMVIRVLALRQPWAIDLREVLSALRIAIELERICDHAEDLAERVITLGTARVEPVHSLVNLGRFAVKMVDDAIHAYTQRDATEAQQVWSRDAELDVMYTALFRELLTYMIEDPRGISANTQMLFMARAIERIGDRATNIAETVRYLVGGTPVEEERPKADATKSILLPTASPNKCLVGRDGEEISMLYEIEILEARRIAELAAAARDARDRSLTPVPEAELGEPPPARGEHHAAGTLGFAGVPEHEPVHLALRQAIEALPSDIRRKLWAVMRTGSGDYARGNWDQAMAAADNLSDESILGDLAEEVDLHDKLMKGLYEIGAAEPPGPAT